MELSPLIAFEKWQGLGNHFIIVDAPVDPARVPELCDPRRGVGADGLIVVTAEPPRMRIYNADGSLAAMCGNGLRCAARFLARRGVTLKGGIATDAGVLAVREVSGEVTVEVGHPRIVGTGQFRGEAFISVDIGNPHAVFLDPGDGFDLVAFGTAMQRHPDFPAGVNVHEVRSGQSPLNVTPFERGVGLTQACGTGAAAAAFAAKERLGLPWPIATELPGGTLVFVPGEAGMLWMTGPAEHVFSGRLP